MPRSSKLKVRMRINDVNDNNPTFSQGFYQVSWSCRWNVSSLSSNVFHWFYWFYFDLRRLFMRTVTSVRLWLKCKLLMTMMENLVTSTTAYLGPETTSTLTKLRWKNNALCEIIVILQESIGIYQVPFSKKTIHHKNIVISSSLLCFFKTKQKKNDNLLKSQAQECNPFSPFLKAWRI